MKNAVFVITIFAAGLLAVAGLAYIKEDAGPTPVLGIAAAILSAIAYCLRPGPPPSNPRDP